MTARCNVCHVRPRAGAGLEWCAPCLNAWERFYTPTFGAESKAAIAEWAAKRCNDAVKLKRCCVLGCGTARAAGSVACRSHREQAREARK